MQGLRNHSRVSGHPNIVGLLEAYEDSGCLYSITEDPEQVTLSTQKVGVLPEGTVARWGFAVAEALAHCHEQGEDLPAAKGFLQV